MNTISPSNSSSSIFKNKWVWLIVLALIAGGGYKYYSSKNKGADGADSSAAPTKKGAGMGGAGGMSKPMPVVTAIAKTDDIHVYLNGLGTVTPLATATVKARVDGEITKIHFTEGQLVKQGQILLEIDARPFNAALMQAQGQLMRDQALLDNAQLDLKRYQDLLKQDSIAAQQVDTQNSLVHQLQGTVKMDQALVATAALNVSYTKVTAPVSGRIGLRQVDLGNVVHAGDTNGVAIITQLQPMSVLFSLPEDAIVALNKNLTGNKKMIVDAYDRAFKQKITTGELQTIDNQIDPTTGMVKIRALFSNADLSLFPSQFVNAKVLVDVKHNIITVPSSAIQRGVNGSFAYVVGSEKTVSERKIEVGTTQGDKAEIVSGLKVGDVVVIDGADKLRDGAKVDISSNNRAENSKDNKTNKPHADIKNAPAMSTPASTPVSAPASAPTAR